jgi:hypothetical protein
VGSTTGFHADQAGRQIAEKRQHLMTLQLLLQHSLAALIHAMDLKYVFRQINTDCRNLHGGRSRSVSVDAMRSHFGTSDAVKGVGASIPLGKDSATARRLDAAGAV